MDLDRSDIDAIYRMVRMLDSGAARQISDAAYEGARQIQQTARAQAPYKTGALAASIRPRRKGGSAAVSAGGTSRVPYAKVIHFGSPRRNIAPNKFMFRAADANADEVAAGFLEAVVGIWNEVMA